MIDIANGDTVLSHVPEALAVDNSACKRKYFIRTSASFPAFFCESTETIGGVRYAVTKEISVADMHKFAEMILSRDEKSFFAGFEY
jgi:hypothetical protein